MNDPIVEAVRFLATQLDYARHQPWAEEFLADIEACAGVIRGVASGPKERRYLGPCGADVPQPGEGVPDLPCCVATACEPHGGDCCHHGNPVECPADPYVGDVPCEGAVYGGIGGKWATCKECGVRYDQAARIRERAELAGQYTYTASEIAEAYPALRANTITKWHGRGLLVNHGDEMRPLYDVAEVLRLADSADERHRQALQRRHQPARV